jgi:hypothetical protein
VHHHRGEPSLCVLLRASAAEAAAASASFEACWLSSAQVRVYSASPRT